MKKLLLCIVALIALMAPFKNSKADAQVVVQYGHPVYHRHYYQHRFYYHHTYYHHRSYRGGHYRYY